MISLRPLLPCDFVIMDEIAGLTGQWNSERFTAVVRKRQPRTFGLAAILDDSLVGYLVYSRGEEEWKILSLAVNPDLHRSMIGSCLVRALIKEPDAPTIVTDAPDDNLGFHLFLKANGFVCVKITKNLYRFQFEGWSK